MRKRVLIGNYTAPEMNYLAAALARDGNLVKYVRPYANLGRAWERGLGAAPLLGGIYKRTLGRRTLPPELTSHNVCERGVMDDFLSALLARINTVTMNSKVLELQRSVQTQVERDLARSSNDGVDMTIASYSVARKAFLGARSVKVLNYPSTHHRYMKQLSLEEAEREPEFADSLPEWNRETSRVHQQLDEELELADRILVGSTFAKTTFVDEGVDAGKLYVIPYGVDCDLFKPKERVSGGERGLRVLFAGSIGQRKGISYLLRGYEKFRSTDSSLTLVGSFYRGARSFWNYSSLFQHIPHQPRTSLVRRYQEADVFVFPSLMEGMGLVALEAMACGLPVITTQCGPNEVVRDGIDGFVVAARDEEAIAEKLTFFRENPGVKLSMGENARKQALKFSWRAYQSKVIDAIGL